MTQKKPMSIEDFKKQNAPKEPNKLTKEEAIQAAKDLKKEYDKSADNDKPYTISDSNGDPVLVGDPNQANSKPHDYKLTFWLTGDRIEKLPYKDATVVEGDVNRYLVTVDFKNVVYNAFVRSRVIADIVNIMPFFNKMEESGLTEPFTDEASLKFITGHFDEFIVQIYKIIKAFFDIDDDWVFDITPGSATTAMVEIFKYNPDLINAGDGFFD